MREQPFQAETIPQMGSYSLSLKRGLWTLQDATSLEVGSPRVFITATEAFAYRSAVQKSNPNAIDQTDPRTLREFADFLRLEEKLDRLFPQRGPKLSGIVTEFSETASGLSITLGYKLPDGEKRLNIHYNSGPEARNLAASLASARALGLVSKLTVTVESSKVSLSDSGRRVLSDPPSVVTAQTSRVSSSRGVDQSNRERLSVIGIGD